MFTSLKPEDDPYTIELEKAIELIIQKRELQASRLIKAFPEQSEITIVNGRFGPYISFGKSNVKIPKGTDPASLTLEQCFAFAEEQGKTLQKVAPKSKSSSKKKETTTKKTSATKKTTAAKKTTAKKTATKKTTAKKVVKKKTT